jgi:hypothetical protein
LKCGGSGIAPSSQKVCLKNESVTTAIHYSDSKLFRPAGASQMPILRALRALCAALCASVSLRAVADITLSQRPVCGSRYAEELGHVVAARIA